MPLMRDKSSGIVREVSERYLQRWPADYEPVSQITPEEATQTTTVESESGGEAQKEESV